jgi:hypothetical protein
VAIVDKAGREIAAIVSAEAVAEHNAAAAWKQAWADPPSPGVGC